MSKPKILTKSASRAVIVRRRAAAAFLATALGEELARRGHEVHFISYERPFRLPENAPRLFFHPVVVNDYPLFKYPDYTLPLSVRMAEVSRDHKLDVLHVHFCLVPHATAAIQRAIDAAERSNKRPRVVTTLHGTRYHACWGGLIRLRPGHSRIALRQVLDAITAPYQDFSSGKRNASLV